MVAKMGPRRPIAGGSYYGLHPERYEYWRVGYGAPEGLPLDFWFERVGEFHCKPNYVTGEFHWTHTVQLFFHLEGEALFETRGCSVKVARGDMLIIPAYRPFFYRCRRGLKYHWLGLAGQWPAVLGREPAARHLSLKFDAELEARFTEIREALILQKRGYPLKAVGIFYELVARIEEITHGLAGTPSAYPEAVRNAIVYLTENYADPFSAKATAAAVSLSESHLRALFEKWVGESPKQFHTRLRIDQARRLLSQQGLSVSEVAGQVGFDDIRHFSRVFKRRVGVSPSRYGKGEG